MRTHRSPGDHVCPWWLAFTFDNALRRLVHDPAAVVGPYLVEGMRALDVGCGMGHFSIGMARLVGETGRVYAVDLQDKMLEVMTKRARKAGVANRLVAHRCEADTLGLPSVVDGVDFSLVFWMAHEVPDPGRLFGEIHARLADSGRVLYAEPSFQSHLP